MENAVMRICPSDCFGGVLRRMPHNEKITFFAAAAAGLLTHMYMFTNKLPNHDDIGHMLGETYGTQSGRWFLPLLEKLDGSFSMPWLIGVLSILMLAAAACCIVSLLRIRTAVGCVLAAAILVTFPAVGATFTYMFSADAYFLSLALACFAVYITNRYRFGFLAGIASITLSLGIYQGYFGVAAALCVGVLIIDLLDGDMPLKRLLLKGLKLLVTLAAGLAVYFVIVKLTTRTAGLVDYMGISEMGGLSLGDIPALIRTAFDSYGSLYFCNDLGVHFDFLPLAFKLSCAAALVIAARTAILRRLKILNIALLIVLLALYPLAGNIIFLMVPQGGIHALMLYGAAMVLILPIALAETWRKSEKNSAKPVWQIAGAVCSWVIVITLALTSYSYAIFTNEAYMKLDLAYEQTYSFSTRLLSAVEQTQGYTAVMPIVIVGSNYALEETPELDEINLTGVVDMNGIVNGYTYGLYLQRYLGYMGEVYLNGSETSEKFAAMEKVAAMAVYPESGGIAVIDGAVVVKLG